MRQPTPALLTALAAALLLAGCGAPAPAINVADAPNETVIEDNDQDEQANLANQITAEAHQTDAEDANAEADGGTHHYACDNKMTVDAVHGDDGNARLTIDGATYALAAVAAASGAKYRVVPGLTPGKSLIWWTKGDSAMLIQAPKDAPEGSPGESIANCLETEAAAQ